MSLLRLDSVWKAYPRGQDPLPVLRDVSLDVEAGSLVSIYGPRGAGKTTLLRLAAGFERPDGGAVSLDGQRLDVLSTRRQLRARRATLGWIDRRGPHDDSMTVADHAALGLLRGLGRRQARQRALGALAAIGVEQYARERWSELSDSARILCAIGQTLARDPRLVIADDPTAGLGILDRERVCGVLRTAAEERGVGVLIAVPDMPSMLQSHVSRALVRGRLLGPTQPGDPERGKLVALPLPRSA